MGIVPVNARVIRRAACLGALLFNEWPAEVSCSGGTRGSIIEICFGGGSFFGCHQLLTFPFAASSASMLSSGRFLGTRDVRSLYSMVFLLFVYCLSDELVLTSIILTALPCIPGGKAAAATIPGGVM